MALYAFVAPIEPGKLEEWKRFAKELEGPRKAEFEASRNELGVRERAFLQSLPHGDFVIVTWEGRDPRSTMKKLGRMKGPFADWFAEKVREIHGFDLRTASEPSAEPITDTQGGRPSAPSIATRDERYA